MKQGKLSQLCIALWSILAQHCPDDLRNVTEILVINEFGPGDPCDYRQTIEAIHPSIEFIQKGPDAAGQARTLNMILGRINSHDYWMHWEESWQCTRPFIAEAIDVMRSTNLTQVQVTPDWLDIGLDRIVHSETATGTRYAQILPHPRTAALVRGASTEDFDRLVGEAGMGAVWPLFSLRPGINRVAFYRELPPFDEDPRYWPVRFEWKYGVHWLERGATKAVLVPYAAQRQPHHVSTYRQ
ncbi:hypothetical protein [Nocardia sp. NPDC051463]|uniref:hypothetical protein n=1 Tax=Nocardia sp. NPDC051463 TaxID=3154845 RepID=UPI003438DBAE